MRFTKMQGLGNDYIYLNCMERMPDNLPQLAVQMSDRHFGVGADGIICIMPSKRADFRMRIFNADGSEGEMCGNGIRCLAEYVMEKGLTEKKSLTIETGAGIRMVEAAGEGCFRVDMGSPKIGTAMILEAAGETVYAIPVSMGNPHAVIFTEELAQLDLWRLGSAIERHPAFPNRTNVEFVRVAGRQALRVRVWERGSGETLACGTGACAVLAVAVSEGRTDRQATVSLPGGALIVDWSETDGHIYMTGPASTVFEGEYSLN